MRTYNFDQICILIAESDNMMRRTFGQVIRSFGCKNTIEVPSGVEAFNTLQHSPVHIVVCEWMMQPMNGRDFVNMVRKGEGNHDPMIPILMMTAHTELSRVLEARDVGVNEFLAKPVSAKSLFSRITHIIDHPRPFIQSDVYVGPDRRRQVDPKFSGEERRGKPGGEAKPPVRVFDADSADETADAEEPAEAAQAAETENATEKAVEAGETND